MNTFLERARCLVLLFLVSLTLGGCTAGGDNDTYPEQPVRIVKIKQPPNETSRTYRSTIRVEARTTPRVTDVEWGTVVSPSGASVGLKDYDDYVVVELSDTGSYVIRATALRKKRILGADTVTVNVE